MKDIVQKEVDAIPQYEFVPIAQAYETIVSEGVTKSEWVKVDGFRGIRAINSDAVVAVVRLRYSLMQFKTVFDPVLEMFSDVGNYSLTHADGAAMLSLFPTGDEYKIDDEQRLGVVVWNSVDCTTSVIMKFTVRRGNHWFVLPKKFGQFKSKHTGEIAKRFKAHTAFVDEAKTKWVLLLERMKNVKMDAASVAELVSLKIFSDTFVKKHPDLFDMTVWEAFLTAYNEKQSAYAAKLGRGKTNEQHIEKEVGKFTEALFSWALMSCV